MELVMCLLAKAFGNNRYAKVIVCLVLLSFGIPKSEIKEKLGVSYPTLRKYKTALENGEIEGLIEFKGSRTKSALDDYEEIILKEFDKNPPKSLRDAQERILKLTGLPRSLHRIHVWLKKRAFQVEP